MVDEEALLGVDFGIASVTSVLVFARKLFHFEKVTQALVDVVCFDVLVPRK